MDAPVQRNGSSLLGIWPPQPENHSRLIGAQGHHLDLSGPQRTHRGPALLQLSVWIRPGRWFCPEPDVVTEKGAGTTGSQG